MMRRLLHVLLLLALPRALAAQDPPVPTPATTATSTLRVFVDNCPCSLDYLRTEITYIDYVRDRADADVHLLFGYQRTGGGGTAYTLYFIGLRPFAGIADTLRFDTEASATEDHQRQMLVKYMKMGLMRYIAHTAVADRIRITLAPPPAGQSGSPAPADDPWNYWVFSLSLRGGGNSEKSQSRIATNGSLSASRTTEQWKTRISSNGRYDENKVTVPTQYRERTLEDGTVVIDTIPSHIVRTYGHAVRGHAFIVRSVGPHFSTGVTSSVNIESFANQDLFVRVAPAVEYSLFPYSESTRRQLFFNYSVGYNAFDYRDTTIYYKTSEKVLDHQIQVSYQVTEPWGSAFGALSGQQYLHDTHLYSASAFVSADIRLFKGFSLSFFGSAATIYNQIWILKRGLTDTEVLLNRRQQATPYRVSGNVGIRYTFGSIFNNIVNPRFSGGGGEIFIF